jgi:hypothetical protein
MSYADLVAHGTYSSMTFGLVVFGRDKKILNDNRTYSITMVNSRKFYDTIERVYKTEDKELEQQSCSNDAFF